MFFPHLILLYSIIIVRDSLCIVLFGLFQFFCELTLHLLLFSDTDFGLHLLPVKLTTNKTHE